MSSLILLMFFTLYTQLVLNQCQLIRPNWPGAPMLAFCGPGLKETEFWQGGRCGSAWAPFPSTSPPGMPIPWMLEHSSLLPSQDTAITPSFWTHLRKSHIHADGCHLHIHGFWILPGPRGCLATLLFPYEWMKTHWLCLCGFGNLAISQHLECEIRQMEHSDNGRGCIWHQTDRQSCCFTGWAKTALIPVYSWSLNAFPQSRKRHESCGLWVQIPPLPLTLWVLLNRDLRFGFSNP